MGGFPWATVIVTADMNSEQKLQKLLDKAGVVHFKAYEFFVKGGSHYNARSRAYKKNTDPPDELLPSIIPTAVVLDKARRVLGTPIIISSAYRSKAYNKAIGGATSSYHMRFNATDVIASDLRELYRVLRKMRDREEFSGGLGGYSGFVHIDTRGYDATWGINY